MIFMPLHEFPCWYMWDVQCYICMYTYRLGKAAAGAVDVPFAVSLTTWFTSVLREFRLYSVGFLGGSYQSQLY